MGWCPKKIRFHSPKSAILTDTPSHDHPLKPMTITILNDSKSNDDNTVQEGKKQIVSTSWGGIDPLSAALQESDFFSLSVSHKISQEPQGFIESDFKNWSSRKAGILNEFVTSEKLSIKTSFLSGGCALSLGSSVRNLQNTTLAEKVKHRLEQLDDFDEGSVREMINLTQQEYVNRIEDLNIALKESWEQDQRVKALKIVIQCAKLLDDTEVPQFYPSKFILITDTLDNFGNLVYERIHCKAESQSAIESAKATCRNWFFKIASIRELIPRFYVEASILRSLSFIVDSKDSHKEHVKALERLSSIIRGVGNPLVALYCRAYLCKIAMHIAPSEKSIFQQNYNDLFFIFKHFHKIITEKKSMSTSANFNKYLVVCCPALDWILDCLTYKAPEELHKDIFAQFKDEMNEYIGSSVYVLFLNSLISSLRPEFVVERAKEFINLVKSSLPDNDNEFIEFPSKLILSKLGSVFSMNETNWLGIDEEIKLKLMNEIWRKVSKLKASDHIKCADVWMDFVVCHFGIKEINALLQNVVKHLQPDRAFEKHHNEIISMIKKVMRNSKDEDPGIFFSMDSFIPFLDMLKKDYFKVEACKIISESFLQKFKAREKNSDDEEHFTITDPMIINSMTHVCKIMHDSLDILSLDDERRQISLLIVDFLSLVSFDIDFQSHLDFLVESRSNYCNLEAVITFLIYCANSIVMKTSLIAKGLKKKKITNFIHACIAFSYITIPSLNDVITSLQLCLNSAQVSLFNKCLPQTDSFLSFAINLLPQFPLTVESNDSRTRSNEPLLLSYIQDILSFLLLVPDHPEKKPLYLFRNLFQVVIDLNYNPEEDTLAQILLNFIRYLSLIVQEKFPYHINDIDSNDTLYCGNEIFLKQVYEITDLVIEHLLIYLKNLSDKKLTTRQSAICLDSVYMLARCGNTLETIKLIKNLWRLGINDTDNIQNFMKCICYLRSLAVDYDDKALDTLCDKIESLIT